MVPCRYNYVPLARPWHQIRLLTVFPSRDPHSDIQVSLSIHMIPLSDASHGEKLWARLWLPSYCAISYRWLRDSSGLYILIDGRRLRVHETVYNALRSFRSYASTPLHHWIDCVCINQEDETERSQQVSLMPEIYGLSMMTIVWLGMPTPESKRATNFIMKLTQQEVLLSAIDAFLDLQPPRTVMQSDEALFTRLRRILQGETIRLGHALITILAVESFGVWELSLLSYLGARDVSLQDASPRS